MDINEIPFSKAADSNKEVICEALKAFVTDLDRNLLEIGSGTGQHAVYMSTQFPKLKWQTSDLLKNHAVIKYYIKSANLKNILDPIEFEAGVTKLPRQKFNIIYTANTFHIMSWKKVKTILKAIQYSLNEGGQFIVYGPFNFENEFTSESNKDFDTYLKELDPQMGIRNFNDIEANLKKTHMLSTEIVDMPKNNKLLVFTKITKEIK
jgi:cyclopropane fatty-acyl-phospholipid synthase-like methyltransferase